MAIQLAQAYVQIMPSAKGIKSSLTKELGGEVASAGASAGESMGASLVGTLKKVVAAAGIGSFIKSALDAGGAVQQSFGGLDTLYGDASEAAKEYARAAASAGISMNDYAEQAVSFGASLKSAFNGDTVKAAEAANTAIMDMADNSAKMGTDISAVQTAYQGFAKQNYTMLDNLKLGYGGTKSEMERLLKDAEKLSGVKYNIDNLGDVYDAIHVIQVDLGLTGVAAQEASETFSGSAGAMKAAFQNFLADLTTGQNMYNSIQTLLQSAETMLINNLMPMAMNVIDSLPQVINNILFEAALLLEQAAENTDAMVEFAANLIADFVAGIGENIQWVIAAAIKLAIALGKSIVEFDWMSVASDAIWYIKTGTLEAAEYYLGTDEGIVDSILNGIMSSIPNLITGAFSVITSFAGFILENLPKIQQAGVDLILKLVNGIVDNIPAVIEAATKAMVEFIKAIGPKLPDILKQGIEIIGQLAVGLVGGITKIIAALPQIINTIKDGFNTVDWATLGKNIIDGVINGLKNAGSALWDALKELATTALNSAKEVLGIHSPSRVFRDQVGKQISAGIALGVTDNMDIIETAMSTASRTALNGFNGIQMQTNNAALASGLAGGGVVYNQTVNVNREISTPDELARALRTEQRYGLMRGPAYA